MVFSFDAPPRRLRDLDSYVRRVVNYAGLSFAWQIEHRPSAVTVGCLGTSAPQIPQLTILSPPYGFQLARSRETHNIC